MFSTMLLKARYCCLDDVALKTASMVYVDLLVSRVCAQQAEVKAYTKGAHTKRTWSYE